MKKIIKLFILLQASFMLSSAQSYVPILSEQNSWNVLGGQCDASMVDSIFTINDSIVNSKIYATLYNRDVSNKIGILEEDTDLGKLMYHDNQGNSYLVFDISLVANDVISFIGYYGDLIELVVSDTYTIDNLKYIEFKENIVMCSFETKFVMIESVGPNVGIHNVSKYFNHSFENYVLCNYKSGEYYFGNELFNNECHLNWTSIQSNEYLDKVNISIVGNELIVINHLHAGEITIHSLQGTLLVKKEINPGSNSIALDALKPGIYIYSIKIDDKVISDKFIRN